MKLGLRDVVLPPKQLRTLDELREDLDLRSGDAGSKQSAFWTMLLLSAVIATAGVLADSTATVIGAMIIAPLSTPIMGIALGLVIRQKLRAGRFVLAGVLLVVIVGVIFTLIVPGSIDLRGNSQITGRTSPTLLDFIAAIATGFAGAVGLSRRDVAAVLPGVAIAISLVPPLGVVGVCLGEGAFGLALGALLLFVSNLISLVLSGTVLFAALGYSAQSDAVAGVVGAERRSFVTLGVLLSLVMIPLVLNTAFIIVVNTLTQRAEEIGEEWVKAVPGASVTGVDLASTTFQVHVRTPGGIPPTEDLLRDLQGRVPDGLSVVVDTTQGQEFDAGTVGREVP